jgi:hypothetical protein
MGDTRVTNLDITRQFLEVFHSNLVIAKNLDHSYEKNFGTQVGFEGQKIGPVLNVREPIQTTVRSGWGMQQQDITETYKTLTIDTVYGVDLKFSDADMATTIDDFEKRYIEVPAKRLAAAVDAQCAQFMADRIANTVAATALAVPTTIDTYLEAGSKLKSNLVPVESGLCAIIDPVSERKIVNGLAGQYNPMQNISELFLKGQMSMAAGFDWYMSQILPTLTTGSSDHVADGLRVKATTGWLAAAPGTLVYDSDSTTTGTIKVGECFTISGVKAVNYETKQTLSYLKQFCVVTADVTSSGGEGTITFEPPIYTSGPLQNVSAAPTLGSSTITLGALDGTTAVPTAASTAYGMNLVFSPKSFAFASVPLRMPEYIKGASVSQDNFNIRFLRGYDIANARYLSRMDIFFGLAELRRDWACKILHV